jgi:hypothetical protein
MSPSEPARKLDDDPVLRALDGAPRVPLTDAEAAALAEVGSHAPRRSHAEVMAALEQHRPAGE